MYEREWKINIEVIEQSGINMKETEILNGPTMDKSKQESRKQITKENEEGERE